MNQYVRLEAKFPGVDLAKMVIDLRGGCLCGVEAPPCHACSTEVSKEEAETIIAQLMEHVEVTLEPDYSGITKGLCK